MGNLTAGGVAWVLYKRTVRVYCAEFGTSVIINVTMRLRDRSIFIGWLGPVQKAIGHIHFLLK